MIIKTARFLISNSTIENLPPTNLPEYAFIGRSNVGKSSLINMLVNKKNLAKTSQTPGKTKLINHFIINEEWYLVDLPGYGFARASHTERARWEQFIRAYLVSRANLQCVMVLIDSRLSPQKNDLDFINWLGEKGIPFVLVFTKSDKQSKQKTSQTVELFKKEMLRSWETLPESFITSSEERIGKNELLAFIANVNEKFKKNSFN